MARTLEDLFQDQIQDAYSAEMQLCDALPKMARAATSPELRAAFVKHYSETQNQLGRIERVCNELGYETGSNTCEAMQGLIAEAEELMEMELDPETQDAALVMAAQKVEHYEIALYGTLCCFAKQLGHDSAGESLHETLEEEKRADLGLSSLAKADINRNAMA
jgi:ferritin-like metal-binding protein YciE